MAMFSRCKKAELTDDASGQKITAGVSIGPLDSLMVALPTAAKFKPGKTTKIKFLDPTLGVVTCTCALTAPLLTGDKRFVAYRCRVLEQLSRDQRREDIKIPLTSRVQVSLQGSDSSAPATVSNISAGGVYLCTSLPAQKGDKLTFTFLETGAAIPLTAEILRAEHRPDLGGIGYGCRFIHLSPQYEAQLRAYIFQEERRLYQREKEKQAR